MVAPFPDSKWFVKAMRGDLIDPETVNKEVADIGEDVARTQSDHLLRWRE